MSRFVKAMDTDVPVSRSQGELERVLRRYRAFGFGHQADYAAHIVRINFRVPDAPESELVVPVRLEVNIAAIAQAMYGAGATMTPYRWEQAERVAWRHLLLWVDAACSAANAGLQTMSEAFLAHALVTGPDGKVRRVVELLDAEAGAGGYRALLPQATS